MFSKTTLQNAGNRKGLSLNLDNSSSRICVHPLSRRNFSTASRNTVSTWEDINFDCRIFNYAFYPLLTAIRVYLECFRIKFRGFVPLKSPSHARGSFKNKRARALYAKVSTRGNGFRVLSTVLCWSLGKCVYAIYCRVLLVYSDRFEHLSLNSFRVTNVPCILQ